MIALTLLLMALTAPTRAQAGDKLVLIAERTPVGRSLEQMAVIFEDGQVRITSNANFLIEDSGKTARIGHLRSPMSPLLDFEKRRLGSMAQALERKPAVEAPRPEGPPHALHVRLNGRAVLPTSAFYRALLSTFERIHVRGSWMPLDAVTVSTPGAKAQVKWEGTGKAPAKLRPHCVSESHDTVCRVPGYGVAYFR